MVENTFFIPLIDTFFERNKPLNNLCSYKTGGNASYYFEPNCVKDLNSAIIFCRENNIPFKIIGNGTNLLISDKGYNGLIINLKNFSKIEILKNGEIKAYAGVKLNKLIDFCAKLGYSGLENLYGIPATVGGAIVMNAGAFNSQIFDFVSVVETIKDDKFYRLDKDNIKFLYRKTQFLYHDDAIISVRFNLKKDDPTLIKKRIKNITLIRNEKQPKGRCCGSVFKNPKGYFAGELIERANLKGKKIGGAEVSDKHANFIVASKNCTSLDIKSLIELIEREVYDKFNVKLTKEIEYVGEF